MSESNLRNLIIASSSIILIIIIALVISFAINKSGINSLAKEAESYIEEGDYKEASNIYAKLISKTNDKKYKDKKKETELMERDARQYEMGVSKIENEDYINAIRYFKKINKEDEYFTKKAKEQLEIAESSIFAQVEQAINDDNTYLASSILSDYVSIVGKNEKAEELLASLDGTAVVEEEDDDEVETGEITSELPEDSKDWVGKTFEIRSGKANIRETADLNGKVVTTIAKGGTISIEEVKEDGDRVWCYGTVTSLKTGETFKAWISSKNL